MLRRDDIAFLEDVAKGTRISDIPQFFQELTEWLSGYLSLPVVRKSVTLEIGAIPKNKMESILDLGIHRVDYSKIILSIPEDIIFLPFIILRESFYRFIPNEKEQDTTIKIIINQIVETELQTLSSLKDFAIMPFVRKELIDRNFVFGQLERLQKHFKIQPPVGTLTTTQHFFQFVHQNALVQTTDEFYNDFFNDYSYKTIEYLYNEDITETLYALITLFYKYKTYLSINDYAELYKKYLEENKIQSYLSVSRFYDTLQWINKHTSISPCYNYVYTPVGLTPIECFLIFNPLLKKYQVKKLLNKFPFATSFRFAHDSFAVKVTFTFIMPRVYFEDLKTYLAKLENDGVLIEKRLCIFDYAENTLNLNTFTSTSYRTRLINPLLKTYKKEYEIAHHISFPPVSHPVSLSMFEFKLLTNLSRFSSTGLTFDKRIETLNTFKKEMENEYETQSTFITTFRKTFTALTSDKDVAKEFIQFIDHNQDKGFFYLFDTIKTLLEKLQLLEDILETHPEVHSIYQLSEFVKKNHVSVLIEQNLGLKNGLSNFSNIKRVISLYFQTIELYRAEKEKFQSFFNALDSCFNLRILGTSSLIKLLKNPEKIPMILKTKEERLKVTAKASKSYKITNSLIEKTITKFLNNDPPLIIPLLINTILTSAFAKYLPHLIVKHNQDTLEKIKSLSAYFPRIIWVKFTDFYSQEPYLYLRLYSINFNEKDRFISALYKVFGEDLVLFQRQFWKGLQDYTSIYWQTFYDFAHQEFFYTKDLFEQLYLYSKELLGDGFSVSEREALSSYQPFWSQSGSMKSLVDIVNTRLSLESKDFTLSNIQDLVKFREGMASILREPEAFKEIKNKNFFQMYISSIYFTPAFRKFGMSRYHLYVLPDNWEHINLKLLFTNSFQSVKCPASFGQDQFLYLTYLFPYHNPNMAHLNWVTRSKKTIGAYCLFCEKKMYEIIHFDHSIEGEEGWDYISSEFKTHAQKFLFSDHYQPHTSTIREYDFDEISETSVYGLNSPEFSMLSELYNRKSIDLKSYLGTVQASIINMIQSLLKKNLIFPFLSLKNLDLHDKVYIILPDTISEIQTKLLHIFSYFNISRIYEIEGEYFIKGLPKIKKFENGLLIELWFPQCELDEFFDIFDLIFEYCEIPHYLILSDVVKGNTVLRNVFGNLNFLDSYNPLKNLKWNKKDKIWMNHKLYNEYFEPQYPDLFYGKNREKRNIPDV